MEKQVDSSPTRPKQIFILSGQSNMSGRGGVHHQHWDHQIPPECHSNPSILRFSANSQWVLANEPLHADIDVRKTCGIGPGMSFANSLPPAAPVGLVPCAVGGTAIAEWAKGKHLYEQMIARATAAAAAGGGEIKAVLWYQGESDTDAQSKADVYGTEMEKLIGNVRRDLGLPSLPFLQVALASGMDKGLVRQVREAQLGIDLLNVVCVDAMGLPLNEDNLHLTTDAQVVLGKMLATAYVAHFCQDTENSFLSSSPSPAILMSPSQSTATLAAVCLNVRSPERTIGSKNAMKKLASIVGNNYDSMAALRYQIQVVLSKKLSMQMERHVTQINWSYYWTFKTCLVIVLIFFMSVIAYLSWA